MISRKGLISTGATLVVLGGFTSLAVGAWGPQPKPPKAVAEAPIVITDIQTIHKTVKVKAKPRPVARPAQVSYTAAASGSSYAASNPPERVAPSNSQRSAPSVSTHSSGGEGEYGEREGHESEDHEREGDDD